MSAWESAQAVNAGLGVGSEEAAVEGASPVRPAEADAPRDKAGSPTPTVATEKSKSVAGGKDEEEEGEEVSSKAADALADSLAGAKV